MDTNIVDKLSILPAELTVNGQTGKLQIIKCKDDIYRLYKLLVCGI